jgi:hypothetical protein
MGSRGATSCWLSKQALPPRGGASVLRVLRVLSMRQSVFDVRCIPAHATPWHVSARVFPGRAELSLSDALQ